MKVGIVLGTKPSNPLEFWIGIEKGKFVQLDDIIVVESKIDGTNEEIKFYGIVQEVVKYLEGVELVYDAQLVNSGVVPASLAYMAKVSVTRIEPEVFIPPTPGDPAYKAQGIDFEKALYYDNMRTKIPAGLTRSGDVVYLNYDFINGREGAHISISGMSGVATKTSYALFLLYSIFQKADDRNKIHGIIFNVKGKDLLWIDKKNKKFSKEHREAFEKLGLPPEPFKNVAFYAPPEEEGSDVPSSGERLEGVFPYKWSMHDFAQEGLLRFLFAEGDEGTTSLHYVIDRVTEKLQQLAKESPKGVLLDENGKEINSLRDLIKLLHEVIEDRETKRDPDRYREWFGTAATATAYAFMRRFHHAASHCSHLVFGHTSKHIDWKAHQLSVIDISDLHGIAKMFVVGSILKRIFKRRRKPEIPTQKSL